MPTPSSLLLPFLLLSPFSPSLPSLALPYCFLFSIASWYLDPLHHPSSPSHPPITPTPKRLFNEAYSREREKERGGVFFLFTRSSYTLHATRSKPSRSLQTIPLARCSVAAQLLAFSSTCSSPFSASPRIRGVPVTLAAFNRVARLSFIARLAIDRFPRLSSA